MKKRIVSLALALSLVLAFTPVLVLAADEPPTSTLTPNKTNFAPSELVTVTFTTSYAVLGVDAWELKLKSADNVYKLHGWS